MGERVLPPSCWVGSSIEGVGDSLLLRNVCGVLGLLFVLSSLVVGQKVGMLKGFSDILFLYPWFGENASVCIGVAMVLFTNTMIRTLSCGPRFFGS